jgi:Family of unknown function (DUF6786)
MLASVRSEPASMNPQQSSRRRAKKTEPRVAANPQTLALLGACVLAHGTALGASFGDDVAFLQAHTDLVILSDRSGQAKAAVAPALQGRVMTSTAGGDAGASFGWINRELFASHKIQPHINVFGGEDRFWLGPEGGQFSIFFARGVPFDLEHWYTPAALDTQPFELVKHTRNQAEFRRAFTLTNYSGTALTVAVDRTVGLLNRTQAWSKLGLPPAPGVDLVAFESVNRLQNAGDRAWTPDTGLLSIWILGMFNPSPATTIVVPIKPGPEAALGKLITSDYFGAVPPDRLAVRDNVVFFSGDGQFRSKIGVSPPRCRSILGSYDAAHHALTLVQFTFTPGQTNYVNSKWELQTHPFAGDVANSYNDGPPAPGAKPLGPFYEMESSSPAAALAPGQSLEHVHRTFHLTGPEEELDRVARARLGVRLQDIVRALPRSN